MLKKLAGRKQSIMFVRNVGDEEKRFYKIDTRRRVPSFSVKNFMSAKVCSIAISSARFDIGRKS